MAKIDKNLLSKTKKTRNRVHEVVEGTYSVFEDIGGKKYFQIDTFGTKGRVHKHKISQTIQVDKETAKYLIDIMKQEFLID